MVFTHLCLGPEFYIWAPSDENKDLWESSYPSRWVPLMEITYQRVVPRPVSTQGPWNGVPCSAFYYFELGSGPSFNHLEERWVVWQRCGPFSEEWSLRAFFRKLGQARIIGWSPINGYRDLVGILIFLLRWLAQPKWRDELIVLVLSFRL